MVDKPLDEPIAYPFKGKNDPDLGPVAVLVSNQEDLNQLCDLMDVDRKHHRKLLMSRVFRGSAPADTFSITGPLIGSPYTVMVLENLIAWGARQFIFFGWCGAVARHVKIGDIIIPTSAIIDEGTSRHYAANPNHAVTPATSLLHKIKTSFNSKKVDVHEGLVWTTDAIYRETRKKVEYFQKKNVLAVEMEASALFTVGDFRRVEAGAVLVVSDELSTFDWQRGFGSKRFIKHRKTALEVISRLCKNI
jgi:uridine phosphorylase